MAAKLLQSLADDNPDLQKQIGCMTGIFQIFDRQSVLPNRRLIQKRLPPGESHYANGSSERDIYHQQMAAEMNLSKTLNEKQRVSTESSRTSFSSSCSSSLSSLDCGRTAQPEATSSDRIIFPETPSRDSVLNQSSPSLQLGRQSLDLRDVVKDSMYRETRGLSVRTANRDELQGQPAKHKDSPRPLQLPMSVDELHGTGSKGKQILPADIKESLRVLAKLREAPWYYNDTGENQRSSSYEARDGYWSTVSKDASRFSYDGRERNRLSFESHDTIKSIPKLKELPRLSLDSREILMRGSNSDPRSKNLPKDPPSGIPSGENPYDSQQSAGTQKRPPSVVAKLMGLEALPDSTSTSSSQSSMMRAHPVESGEPFIGSLKVNELSRPVRVPKSPRSSMKEPTSPRWRNHDLVMKPIPKSPIEPAPWKQVDGGRGSQKQVPKPVKLPARTPTAFPSVYSEIVERLRDLEFKQSGKDLRALKQILDAMQVKGLLDTKKEEQDSSFEGQMDYEQKCSSPGQRPRTPSQRTQQKNQLSAFSNKASTESSRVYESPIVIMKPAKLVQKSGLPATSVVPLDSLPGLRKIQSGGNADMRKGSAANRTFKDQNLRNSSRDLASGEKKTSVRNARPVQSLPRTQQPTKESSTTSAMKGSGSVSPRLQQKKLELEKRSRPPTPPADLNKPRRQSSRQMAESSSPGGRQRLRSSKITLNDDQLSQVSNDSRTSSLQGDDVSLQSDVTAILELKMDSEINSPEQQKEIGDGPIQSARVAKYMVSGTVEKMPTSMLEDDRILADLAAAAPEHPSPVSVLDFSAYQEDELSPVKQTSNLHLAECAEDLNDQHEVKWSPMDSFGSSLTSQINRKKLQNVEDLVKKLERLNSNHDESSTDYIASLCEKQNPDHRYISEILLASGLLLRDLSSGLATIQVHPSGHPINPELFFVLEQTKGNSLLARDGNLPGKPLNSKPNLDKMHRKLIFDAVNEILINKLDLVRPSAEPWLKSGKLAKKTLSAQKLLKDLCMEIEQLQVRKPECIMEQEEEEDGLKSILWEDVMVRSDSWTDFHAEVSRIVLEVERSIFKELVDEVVIGEAAGLRAKMGKRRQLFAAK